MAQSVGIWVVEQDRLQRIQPSRPDREHRLETWIESHPDVLGERLLIIGRQVRTGFGGVIDLLALDGEGRCVVIELKRGRTPRDIVAQCIDYVSWVAQLSDADVREYATRGTAQSFEEAYRARFGDVRVPQSLNSDQRMLIVATDVDDATSRIVEHLTRRYAVDINVVTASYFTVGHHEFLARSWVVQPSDLEDRLESRPPSPADGGLNDVEDSWTGLWHVNVGIHADDMVGRNWDDERRYGFLSAGQGPRWRDELLKLRIGDHVYAYVNGAGYVGGGEISSTAVRSNKFVPPGASELLQKLPLENTGWFLNGDDPDLAEYMVGVHWTKTVDISRGLRVAPVIRGTVRKIRSTALAQRLRSEFS